MALVATLVWTLAHPVAVLTAAGLLAFAALAVAVDGPGRVRRPTPLAE